MTNYKPGTITRERLYAIICAECLDGDSAPPDLAFAKRSVRERGWSNTDCRGWVCGTCKEKKTKPESV